jgi:uncharacterized protein YcbK (DUF882 family)
VQFIKTLLSGHLATDLNDTHDTCLQRRRLIQTLAGGAALMTVPGLASATSRAGGHNTRTLSFAHTHTGEQLSVAYRAGSRYLPEGMTRIAYLMRDFRSGDVHPIDTDLMDVLWQVQTNLKTRQPFQIISAYRSPKTNAMLQGRSAHTGVAKNSMHLSGRAIDIRLPGIALADVRDAALEIKRGGVGFYPNSEFVHLDTGRVRRW